MLNDVKQGLTNQPLPIKRRECESYHRVGPSDETMEQSASYLYWCNDRVRQPAEGSLRHHVGGLGGGTAWSNCTHDLASFLHCRRDLGAKFRKKFVSSHRKWTSMFCRLSCWMRDVGRRAPPPRRHHPVALLHH